MLSFHLFHPQCESENESSVANHGFISFFFALSLLSVQ